MSSGSVQALTMLPEGQPSLMVLLVEDEPVLSETLSEALREAGHRSASADTAARARELLATHAIDVVVLDLVLRDDTSESLLTEIAGSLPALLITADATERARSTARRHGVPLLLKPFDLDALLSTLEAAHAERRSRSPA